MPKLKYEIGHIFRSSNGVDFTLVSKIKDGDKYVLKSNIDGHNLVLSRRTVIASQFTDYTVPTVCGKGIVGLGKHKPSYKGEHTLTYKVWKGMLSRCYEDREGKRLKYLESKVSEGFLHFQNFCDWAISRDNYAKYKGNGLCLDSDLLVPSYTCLYSEETCCFLPETVNLAIRVNLLSNKDKSLPLGVRLHKNNLDGSVTYSSHVRRGKFNTTKRMYSKDIKECVNFYMELKQEYITSLAERNRKIMCEQSIESCKNFWTKERVKLAGLSDYI